MTIAVVAGALVLASACSKGPETTGVSEDAEGARSGESTGIDTSLSPMRQAIAFDEMDVEPSQEYKVGALLVCTTTNTWCQAMWEALQEGFEAYGMTYELYDANFNPDTQLKQAQDAVAKGGYDAFILQPVATVPGCRALQTLQEAGKPVVTGNSPMCDDEGYTEGTVGLVATSLQPYYDAYADFVFSQCEGDCQLAAIGGTVGQDGFNRWEAAIDKAQTAHPNVEVVTDQAASYDPNEASAIMEDTIQANPELDVVFSAWDEMSRGIITALETAGKEPGSDVRIYSIGATEFGAQMVEDGTIETTLTNEPYPAGYYMAVELIRYLEYGELTPGWSDTGDWLKAEFGFDTNMITPDNVSQYEASY